MRNQIAQIPPHHPPFTALPNDPSQLWSLLRETSRSFYLTLRVLPEAIRPQIGLAYLLARATDTVADTDVVPVEDRLATMEGRRRRILGDETQSLDLHVYVEDAPQVAGSASPAERALLSRIEDAISLLRSFSPDDQRRIQEVMDVITSGQELDLRRFGAVEPGAILSLNTSAELDDYTYRVAGCVGEFWTRTCDAHLFSSQGWHVAGQLRDGIRFGKGLQLVNILRDLPKDLRSGRCYLPSSELKELGLEPASLINSTIYPRLRPLYDQYLSRAESHLEAGWNYVQGIPNGGRRVKFGCALPILIGFRTIALLRRGNPLDASRRIKVNRAFVRGALWRSFFAVWGLGDWNRLKTWAREGA